MRQWSRQELMDAIDAAWADWVRSEPCPACGAQPGEACVSDDHELSAGGHAHGARAAQLDGDVIHDPAAELV